MLIDEDLHIIVALMLVNWQKLRRKMAIHYEPLCRHAQVSWANNLSFGCRTTKLLSQKRHHLAVFCISFLSQRRTLPEKRRDYYLKKFCIDRTAISFYDFVQIDWYKYNFKKAGNPLCTKERERESHELVLDYLAWDSIYSSGIKIN
jgi:hypothetical protein